MLIASLLCSARTHLFYVIADCDSVRLPASYSNTDKIKTHTESQTRGASVSCACVEWTSDDKTDAQERLTIVERTITSSESLSCLSPRSMILYRVIMQDRLPARSECFLSVPECSHQRIMDLSRHAINSTSSLSIRRLPSC